MKRIVLSVLCLAASLAVAQNSDFFGKTDVDSTFSSERDKKEYERNVLLDIASGGKIFDEEWKKMRSLLDVAQGLFQELSDIVKGENCPDEALNIWKDFANRYPTWLVAYQKVNPEQRNLFKTAQMLKAFGETMSLVFKAVDKTGVLSTTLDMLNAGILVDTGNADPSTLASIGLGMADLAGKLPSKASAAIGVALDAKNVLDDISKIYDMKEKYISSIPQAKKALDEMRLMVPAYEKVIAIMKERASECPVNDDGQVAFSENNAPNEIEDPLVKTSSGIGGMISVIELDSAQSVDSPLPNSKEQQSCEDVAMDEAEPLSTVSGKDSGLQAEEDFAGDDPRTVVAKFVSVLKDWITGGAAGGVSRDYDDLFMGRLASLCTPESRDAVGAMMLLLAMMGREEALESLESGKIGACVVNGDNATIAISARDPEDGSATSGNAPLKMIGGKWKIDLATAFREAGL